MRKNLSFLSLFILTSALILLSCDIEVGLGSAVDTTAPEITIESPRPGAIIRDEFAIRGSWDDDGTAKAVTVTLKSISLETSVSQTYESSLKGNVPKEKKTWICAINPDEKGKKLPDGTYEISAVIEDNGGHFTTVTRQIVIDNTPPVIVLQHPGTSSNSDVDSADSFGQIFTLEGMAADDNDVDHIDVHVYSDKFGLNELKKITLYNVPPTISLDVAKFVEGEENDYSIIYGSTSKNGTKSLYCSIEAFDSAQRYPIDKLKQDTEDTYGNSTKTFYLYNDIYELILQKYKITEIYHMMNGSYSSLDSSRSVTSIVESVKSALKENEIKTGMFSLNPENSPTFNVLSLEALKGDSSDYDYDNNPNGYRHVTNSASGAKINIKVNMGLDSIPLVDDDTFKVYVVELDSEGKIPDSAIDENGKIKQSAKIYPPQEKKGSSSYDFSVEITSNTEKSGALTVGKKYLFGVDGKDTSGNSIIPDVSTGYGFVFVSAGTPPQLIVEEPIKSLIYVKKGDNVAIKGKAVLDESGAPTISVTMFDGSNNNSPLNGGNPVAVKAFNLEEAVEANGKYTYSFDLTIPNEKFSQTESKQYSFTIDAALGSAKSTVNKTVMYDVDLPKVNITKETPLVNKYEGVSALPSENKAYINGIFKFAGNSEDDFSAVQSTTISVIQDNHVEEISGLISGVVGNTFNVDIDTTKLDNNKTVNIAVKVVDAAGNTDTKNNLYYISQETDTPVWGPNKDTAWTVNAKTPNAVRTGNGVLNVISAGTSIYSKVTDDDGIANVKFEVKEIDYDADYLNPEEKLTQSLKQDIASEIILCNGETETIVSHVMPEECGYYKVIETVTDINGKEDSDWFIVLMKGTAPDVTLTNNTDFIKNGNDVSVTIEVSGLAPYKLDVIEDDGSENGKITRSVYIINPSDTPKSEEEVRADSAEGEKYIYTIEFEPDSSRKSNRVSFRLTDDSSGVTTKSVEYKVDNTNPIEPTITSPKEDNDIVDGESYIFSGKASDGAAVAGETVSNVSKLYYVFSKTIIADTSAITTWNEIDASSGTWNINIELCSGIENDENKNTKDKLYEGSYHLYLKTKDGAGNESKVAHRYFYLDQAEPEMKQVYLNDDKNLILENGITKFFKTDSGDFVVKGKINDTHGVGVVENVPLFTINGKDISDNPNITFEGPDENNDFTWTYKIDREENAEISIDVEFIDCATRYLNKTYKIYCDTALPVIDITNPANDIEGKDSLSSSEYTFRASTDDTGSGIAEVKYLFTKDVIENIENAAEAADAVSKGWKTLSGTTSISEKKLLVSSVSDSSKQLEEGKNYLYVYVKDKMGNKNTARRYFWVDLNDPNISMNEITTPRKSDVVLKGIANDFGSGTAGGNGVVSVTVKVDDKVLDSTGALIPKTDSTELMNIYKDFIGTDGFSLSVNSSETEGLLKDGKHKISVVVTDGAGKTSEDNKIILIDTEKPNGGSITNAPDGSTWVKDSKYAISILKNTIKENGSGIDTVEVKVEASGNDPDFTSGSQTLKLDASDSNESKHKFIANIDIPNQGANSIWLKITDKAENVYISTIPLGTIKLDSMPPSEFEVYEETTAAEYDKNPSTVLRWGTEEAYFYVKPIEGTKLVNGKNSISVYVKADDNKSAGEGKFSGNVVTRYKYGNSKYVEKDDIQKCGNTEIDVPAEFVKITIPANVENGTQYQTAGAANFEVTDSAGNNATYSTFTFQIDSREPEITINSPIDADDTTEFIDVNGILVIGGTSSDENTVSSVVVKYIVGESTPTENEWNNAEVAQISGSLTSWNATIDTTQSGLDKKNLYIKAVVTDIAGNVGEKLFEDVNKKNYLFINQDSDRPVINFANLDISQKNNIWLTGTTKITGTVKDDDDISYFKYYNKKASDPKWQPITIMSGGSWKLTVEDGESELYFEVKDKAGKVFTTDPSASETPKNLSQVKLKYDVSETDSVYIGNGDDEVVKVLLHVDTKAPDCQEVNYQTYDNKKTGPAAASGYFVSSEKDRNLIFGGKYDKFSLKVKVQDDNGVKAVKALFNNTTKVAKIVPASGETETDAKKSSEPHYWIFEDDLISIDSTLNGTCEIKLQIWDNSNLDSEPGKVETLTINVDNTAPEVLFNNYSDGDSVYGSDPVNVRGAARESIEAYYMITDKAYTISETTSNDNKITAADMRTKIKAERKALVNSTGFSVFFDDGTTGIDDLENHDSSLNSYIMSLTSISESDLKKVDTPYSMYMWVYGIDAAGNESVPKCLMLSVTPNGDKPVVHFTYPATNGQKLGGVIRVTGSASISTDKISGVYVQVDTEPVVKYKDGSTEVESCTFATTDAITTPKATAKWYNNLKNAMTAQNANFEKSYTEVHLELSDDEKTKIDALKTNGNPSSWNITLNQNGELNASKFVAIRVFAVNSGEDGKGTKVSEIETIYFQMDTNAPTIGNDPLLQLVQYDSEENVGKDDHIVARQNYEPDMWIKGQWYLVGTVEDNGSGIKSITYKDDNSTALQYMVERSDDKNSIGQINETTDSENVADNAPYWTDSNGTKHLYVEKITTQEFNVPLVDNNGDAIYEEDGVTQKVGKNYNYKLCIPVGKTTQNSFGLLNYTISATEGTNQNLSVSQTISLKYDNLAPEFALLKNGETLNKPTYAEKATNEIGNSEELAIIQNAGNFTFNVVYDEAGTTDASQSGFSKVAFFFARTKDGVTKLIDPMHTNVNDAKDGRGNHVPLTDFDVKTVSGKTVSAHEDGLFWYKYTGATITDTNKINITLPAGKTFPWSIREGGLAKVNGVLYTIASDNHNSITKSGQNVTVSIDGTLQNSKEGESTEVYFALAQVIDHLRDEKGQTAEYVTSGYSYEIHNDDGDQMIETVSNTGTTYTMTASIDSSLILDGDLDMYFVAFDKAGNSTIKTYKANVKNNAPRLYGLQYGTDMSGNGIIDNSEWNIPQKFSVLVNDQDTADESDDVYTNADTSKDDVESGVIKITKTFKIKGLTKVKPLVIGGNVGLGYTYKYKSTGNVYKETSFADFGSSVGHSTEKRETDDLTITLDIPDFLNTSSPIIDGEQKLEFKLWDKTDGKTQGSNSYMAKVVFEKAEVAIRDTQAPNIYFKPFHWNSASDNSLYNNSTANGHIELEKDLTFENSTFTENSGLKDKDPKVSGIVSFDGVVTDNVVVNEISVAIPGFNSGNAFVIATRQADGSWDSVNKVTDTKNTLAAAGWGWQFVNEETLDDGTNVVRFKFHFNTAKISTVAATDVSLVFSAKDRGTAKIETETITATYTDGMDLTSFIWYTNSDCTTKLTTTPANGTEIYRKQYKYDSNPASGQSNPATVIEIALWGDVKTDATTDYYTVNTNGTLSSKATESTADSATVYASRSKTYRVDVVPYVTMVETSLSSIKDNNPSVYDRTSTGHYPVWVHQDSPTASNGSYKTSAETVKIYGFNLAGGTAYEGTRTGTMTAGTRVKASQTFGDKGTTYYSVPVTNFNSGNIKVRVNSVDSLNNENNDAADYNKKPNGDNNNNLTDDVVFDVWQLNSAAARPLSSGNDVTSVAMAINPSSKMIDFGFANGSIYMSYAPGTTASYKTWTKNWDDFVGITMTTTADGKTYGTAIGQDTNAKNGDAVNVNGETQWNGSYKRGESSNFSVISSQWTPTSTGDEYGGDNARRLEKLGFYGYAESSDTNKSQIINKRRIQSPSPAMVTHGTTKTMYLAYADITNGQIRFRYGNIGGDTPANDGQIQDIDSSQLYESNASYWSVVAGYAESCSGTKSRNLVNDYHAGKYVALDVVSGSSTANDTVVLVWYDAVAKKLMYSWKHNPANDNDMDTGKYSTTTTTTNGTTFDNDGYWSEPLKIFDGAGEYCKIKVDSDGGVHIAAYDSADADVKYAYLSNYYSKTVNSCTVDSTDILGTYLTLDVAKVETKQIPYIGYYANSIQKPKIAKLSTTAANSYAEGVTFSAYTGNWEVSVIPTSSTMVEGTINVGVWKNAGELTTSYSTGTTVGKSYSGTGSGVCYGNGTNNAVLGYAITNASGTGGTIETAQMR